jgi:ABC-type transport system involved in multi-copper enzyme maturation permease subunit
MSKPFVSIFNIAKYTISDEVHQRSFLVLFALSVLFVFFVRGCYQGNYIINGRELQVEAIVGTVSRITFHMIAAGMLLLAALFSMRVFRHDWENGMQTCILSKPITRVQYVLGKLFGLWLLSSFFMLVLHAVIFLTVFLQLKIWMPGYLGASLLCTFNLLFVVVSVLLFSLWMPDIVAFLSVMAIVAISFVGDGIYAVSHSPLAQSMMSRQEISEGLTGWKAVYYLWPKISGTQNFASSWIHFEEWPSGIQFYSLINIIIYCIALGLLLLFCFRNKDIG